MANEPPLCTILVPVYGGSSHLEELVSRTETAFTEATLPLPEFVLVDDNGPDDSWSILETIQSRSSRVSIIQLMRNFGQHNALMCAMKHAHSEIVVTIDDDLQHEPESIPRLVKHLIEFDADVVYGIYDSKKHGPLRNAGSWLVNRFYKLVFGSANGTTSFRAIRREVVHSILRYDLNFTYIDGLLAWNTERIETVTVPHHGRASGASGYNFAKLFNLAMNVLTNFSLIPLQAVSIAGLLAAFGGITVGVYQLFVALSTQAAVPGYASTIVAVLTLGGLQLLSLGVIGEYIGRLHLNINRKPQYTIRRKLVHAGGHSSPPLEVADMSTEARHEAKRD